MIVLLLIVVDLSYSADAVALPCQTFLLPPRWNVWISRASDVVLTCFCSPPSKDCSMRIDFYMKILSDSTV